MAANFFDKFDNAQAPQPQGMVLGTPDPAKAYDVPVKQAALRNAGLEAQLRQLQIDKQKREMGGADDAHPAATEATVDALLSGRMAFPSGAGLRSPFWQQMLARVAAKDPNFDQINYNSRNATRREFTAGQSSKNIKALNTAIGHLGQLDSQIGGTASHGGYPFATTVNSVINKFERGSGDSGITNYEQTSGALASELTQVFRGSGGAEADIKRYLSELDPNASEAQKKASIRNIAGLLQSRLNAIGDQYKKGMGTTADPLVMLDEHAQNVMGGLGFGERPNNDSEGGAGGQTTLGNLATGATRNDVSDPTLKLVAGLIRQGLSADQINAVLKESNLGSVKPEDIANAQATLKAGGSIAATQEVPNSLLSRIAGSGPGVAVGAYADAAVGGFADEAAGLIGSIGNGQGVGNSISDANARKQAAFGAHPNWAMGGQVAGGIADFALGAGALRGTAVADAFGSAAPYAGSVAQGFISGAGQDNENRMAGAGIGSIAGAAGYGVGRGLAVPAGALLRTGAGQSVGTAVRKLPGVGRMFAAPPTPAAAITPAESAAAGALNQAGPDAVRASLNEASALGVPMSLADTAPQLTTLAGSAVRRSPNAAQVAEEAFRPRNLGQVDRLGAAVTRDLGPVGNIPQLSAGLMEQAKAAAGPLYEKAYAAPAIGSPELDSLLQTPFGKQAVSRAHTIAANERRNPMELGFSLGGDGDVTLNPVRADLYGAQATARTAVSDAQAAYKVALRAPGADKNAAAQRLMAARGALTKADNELTASPSAGMATTSPQYSPQTLDYVKRGMDDVLEQHRNPITGKLILDEAGRAQNDVKSKLLGEVDKLNPHYAQARAAYAGPVQSRDALARGQDAFSLSPDELGMQVAAQTPENLSQMQLGFRSQLMDRANNVRDVSNPFEATLGAPSARSRVDTLYPNNPGNQSLFRTRELEGGLARSSNSILGNSLTAQRQIADQAFAAPPMLEGAMHAGAALATHGASVPGTAARLLGTGLKDRFALGLGQKAVSKADDLAPLLFNTDPQASALTIEGILARQRAYQDYVQASRPSRALGMFGAGLGVSAAPGY